MTDMSNILDGVQMVMGTPNNFAGEIVLYIVTGLVVIAFFAVSAITVASIIRSLFR